MDHRQRRRDVRLTQVWIEGSQLIGSEHPLVHKGSRRQRGEVHAQFIFDALAHAVDKPVEGQTLHAVLRVGNEDLPEGWHARAGGGSHEGRIGRNFTPAKDADALVLRDRFDCLENSGLLLTTRRQEPDTCGVATGLREVQAADAPHECVRDLQQDARSIATVRFAARCTAVLEVFQSGERLLDDSVGGFSAQRCHERHAACVVLEPRVVETLCGRGAGVLRNGAHGGNLSSPGDHA